MQMPKKIDYRIPRQSSRYWRSLLTSMATEFLAQSQIGNSRELMFKIGERFATNSPLPDCKTVEDLKAAMNSVWQDMDWGWVDVEEYGNGLRIMHHQATNGSLTNVVFGEDTKSWAPATLEGVYNKWFSAVSKGTALKVRQSLDTDEFGSVEYMLSA